jgi:microcystin-dependent protein
MAGLFQLALQQTNDDFGRPIKGALAYFYEASTLTPLPVFNDYNCLVPGPNPWPADGFGRFPAIYLDQPIGGSGFYRFQVTTAEGAIVPGLDLQMLPVIGPSSGGGGGGPAPTPVDPSTLHITGDTVFRLQFAASLPRTGWVRANGNTIGDAASGASERANSDTQGLFQFLWSNVVDAACPVSGGRGATPVADFNAHKRITLPDMRGRAPYGTDKMGAAATAGRLTALTIGGPGLGPDIAGSSGGFETIVLSAAQIPQHTHLIAGTTAAGGGALGVFQLSSVNGSPANRLVTDGGTGGGGSHSNLPPALLGTWYVKL